MSPIPILYRVAVVIFQFENLPQLLRQLQLLELNRIHSHIKDDCVQQRLFLCQILHIQRYYVLKILLQWYKADNQVVYKPQFFHCNSSLFLLFIIFCQYKKRNKVKRCSFIFLLLISTNFS